MPRYRALGLLYNKGLIVPGQEFESDLPPGRNWEPIDDAAKAAVEKIRGEKGPALAALARLENVRPATSAIDIPDDWRTMSKPRLRGLAMKLGAPGTVSAADAETFITAELENRAQKQKAA